MDFERLLVEIDSAIEGTEGGRGDAEIVQGVGLTGSVAEVTRDIKILS